MFTKADAAEMKAEMKTDAAALRAEMKADAAEMRAGMKTDAAALRVEMKADAAEMRAEMRVSQIISVSISCSALLVPLLSYLCLVEIDRKEAERAKENNLAGFFKKSILFIFGPTAAE